MTTTTYLGVVALLALLAGLAFFAGFACAQVRFSRHVFRPWLASLKPGDPNFWLRSRDYDAAWYGYGEAGVLFKEKNAAYFSDLQRYADGSAA